MTWLTALSRGWIIDRLTALSLLAAGILEGTCTYCISCTEQDWKMVMRWLTAWLTALSKSGIIDVLTAIAVLAAGILEGGDDMADRAVKKLDYRCTYCISCTGSRHTGRL